AGRAALALAGEPEPLTGRDPCRDLHRDLPLVVHPARAAAGLARFRDDLSRRAALAARAGHPEEALLIAQLPPPMTRRARRRARPLRSAGSLARLTLLGAGNLDRRLGAARRFVERDLEVVAQVCAALRTASPA